MKTQAPPSPPASPRAPISAVFPSPDSATLEPNSTRARAPGLASFACSDQPERGVREHPDRARPPPSTGAATSAVLPSADSATLEPK